METPLATTGEAARYQIQGFQAVVCSEPMRRLMQMVERVARNNAAVLITGETGTGKEFVARALHYHSMRCQRPWVDLNCAALPEHLVESELFGYEKGAFSGADSMKAGLFELAHTGTLFLDEIGELEPKVQVKLLRVLDCIPYYRLGGNKKVTVDVRIIAATNQDLEVAVRAGRFRSDLYHRLSQIQLKIPPLRERLEDIDALADFFLHQHRPDAHFSSEAVQVLRAFSWPGNVRELRNVILQTAMLIDGNEVRASDLPPEIFSTSLGEAASPQISAPRAYDPHTTDLVEVERQTIMKALASTGGHQGRAADQLGISRRTLSRKLKQYNLNAGRDGGALGFLSREQQQYYRAAVHITVRLKDAAGQMLEVTTLNMSSGGMAVQGIDNPLQWAGPVDVSFQIPGTDTVVELKGRIAWADAQKKAGMKFLDIPPATQKLLDTWLSEKQKEEGWALG